MNKKGVLITLLMGLLSCLFFRNDISGIYLEKAFKKSGACFLNMEIEGHSYIKCGRSPYSISQKMMQTFHNAEVLQQHVDSSQCTILFNSNDLKYNLSVKKLSDADTLFASLSLSQDKGIENINNIRRAISASFDTCGVKASFSTLIEGRYNCRLSQNDMNKTALSCLKLYGGRYVDGYCDGNIISICGYVPNIKEKIECSNKYINVNVAMRYSESENCTYIWLANPIISKEY